MDVVDAIKKRTTIRRFLDKKVPKELIKQVIDAARLAPSGNNAQPWQFYIIENDEKTKRMLKANQVFVQNFCYDAPLIILCLADPNVYKKSAHDDENEKRALRDLSISSAFMVLRAQELYLSSAYIGWVNRQKFKQLYELDEELILPYAILFGYTDSETTSHMRKRLSEVVLNYDEVLK
ncbi:hypothetical protein GOV05_00495 [Candidatus Woesearchaeota archaeon]|nr:hypothetical protein [Candidatus Woesearchaeota archaeon]